MFITIPKAIETGLVFANTYLCEYVLFFTRCNQNNTLQDIESKAQEGIQLPSINREKKDSQTWKIHTAAHSRAEDAR